MKNGSSVCLYILDYKRPNGNTKAEKNDAK